MTEGQMIVFDLKKIMKYIKRLGGGGTGDTHLFLDDTTNTLFAIKKYMPKGSNDTAETYLRFVDEIKILYKCIHPNIVRIYNYYLYPADRAGYIQMEYVEGKEIDKYIPINKKSWNDIFKECISAFVYLESHNILHRDIRPSNVMIDNNNNVKVIDFGFGKMLQVGKVEASSLMLNWPVTESPKEIIDEGQYSHSTEVYFLGKLWSKLLLDKDTESFEYYSIIEKMIKVNPSERFKTFSEISQIINEGAMLELHFNNQQKTIFKKMTNIFMSHIMSCEKTFITEPMEILFNLSEVLKKNALEEYIQVNQELFDCFIQGGYSYYSQKDISVDIVSGFYKFLNSLPLYSQKIVIHNFVAKLKSIKDKDDDADDDLPF